MAKSQLSFLPAPKAPGANTAIRNLLCKRSSLTNEASVEKWFVDKLLDHLGYGPDDQMLKTAIKELKVGRGRSSSLYKPDYIILSQKFPALVIDAKSPDEDLDDWVEQCRSYCLEINTMYEHNPVEYYLLSNGIETKLYKWDRRPVLLEIGFDEMVSGHPKLAELKNIISNSAIRLLSRQKYDELNESEFPFHPVSLDVIGTIFYKHTITCAKNRRRLHPPHSWN